MTDNTITPASNSEVKARFGLSHIMRKAWFAFKFVTGAKAKGFGNALKDAWASLRAQINRERQEAARKAERAASFTGDRNTRSPLNPHKPARFPEWGKSRNREWAGTVAGR